MKKLVIMPLAVFALSLGGTTGALVALGTPAGDSAAVADSAAARDSTHGAADSAAAAAHPPTGAVEHSPSVAAAPAPADTFPAAHAEWSDTAQPVSLHASPGRAEAAQTAAKDTGSADRERDSYRQLARIFANMKTADAAKVLAFMSDTEVQGVIGQLGVRQAAGLLSALPKERAAGLSRRLLQSGMQPAATP